MDGFRLCCFELDAMEAKLASWSFAFVFETFSDHSSFGSFAGESASWTFAPTLLPRCLEKLRKEVNDLWCCEPGLTHLEMVSGEYLIWKWYVFLINDKLFSDQFMHHLWIMVLEIQKKMDVFAYKVVIVEGNFLLLEDGARKDVSSMFDEKLSVMFLLG
ncbi:hypothetical protein Peur_010004 [Populus x canadensis]